MSIEPNGQIYSAAPLRHELVHWAMRIWGGIEITVDVKRRPVSGTHRNLPDNLREDVGLPRIEPQKHWSDYM